MHINVLLERRTIYFPQEKLPEKTMGDIRELSHPKLKRILSNEQYHALRIMLKEVIQIFTEQDIRYAILLFSNTIKMYVQN